MPTPGINLLPGWILDLTDNCLSSALSIGKRSIFFHLEEGWEETDPSYQEDEGPTEDEKTKTTFWIMLT